ncbi:CotH kinase family protein [Bacteroides thetaiotaomicron]|uniref:CotH kinase family protein n=1 Tax=Bacteroides thetaiotaomicron TaxID=818 RepID=UPI002165B05E|nr:CotH kinase family protein [Bacteroides thetaiotaomicron]MCS3198387.1 CotH kinase family protein [Bacteroides thetaiotaomicron]
MSVNYKESILHIVTPNRHGRVFESDYPDEVGEIEFKYLSDLIQFFAVASKEEFAAQYEERLDISSLIDYFIFINLLSAYDNTGRNVFWGIYNVNLTLLPKFIIQPWDLDGTLGRTWDTIKLDPEKVLVLTTG